MENIKMSEIDDQFDWVEFYKELSLKLLTYIDNREALIEKVKRIFSGSIYFFVGSSKSGPVRSC